MPLTTPTLRDEPPSVEAADAGVIEEARARQRSHRRVGGALVAVALTTAALIAGIAGGGGGAGRHAGGQTSGPPPGAGSAHASASGVFPGAPSTQPNGNGVASRACPLAQPNRYLPSRSGCVTAIRADINGDGRSDLILVYSRLGRQHPYWYAAGSVPPSLKHDFVADAAFLKVVLAGGGSASVKVDGAWAAAVDAIAHVNDGPGKEIFLEVSRISSGASAVAYAFLDGSLVPAGVTLSYGGDSAANAGFDCLAGNPPQLVQRTFALIGPTVYGWWRETDVVYDWSGPKLVQIGSRTFRRRGAVTAGEIGAGHGCATGVS
jgi:hypothetical protein